jgi:hypothetical protein
MKKNNIFKNGSLFLAGALAFTFASCQGDTDSNQSTVREAENRVENSELNDEGLIYEEGEYAEVQGEELGENNYDYNQEYAYEERDVVVDRVRNDLDRAERSLEGIDQRIQGETEQVDEQMRREWEESRVELEQRRDDLNMRLNELEQSTEQNWEQVRNEANQSLRDFEKEWDELKNKDINVEVETENNPGNNK